LIFPARTWKNPWQRILSNVFEIKKSLSEEVQPNQYVVKMLRCRPLNRATLFAALAVGLAKEGMVLASLNRKDIIHFQALLHSGVSTYATGRNDAFFIILD
jgi:hypothetical protein